MNVTLIFPRLVNSIARFDEDSLVTKVIRQALHLGKTNYTPPLSLLMLGAVTPPDIEVQIIDERLNEIDFKQQVDLVGITVTTRVAPRAYEIADEYRQRGVTVVLGGIHPTALPQEAIQHADAVVVGEGEEAWPRVLADYQRGELKPFYKGQRQLDLDRLPPPRRELIRDPQRYITTGVVTTSRGCPNSCSFCSAHLAVGKRRRALSVENVIAEVSQLQGNTIVFTDDNLGWDLEYAKQLFRALIPLHIRWFGDASLLAFEDTEFLELAAKSGSVAFEVGFESITPQTISGVKKQQTNDPARYRTLIRRIHEHGILIKGNFILGFDDDDRSIFESLISFINETCIEMPSINTLIPYPGTPIFRQFEREGRLLHKNWAEYDTAGGYVVYEPKQMTRQQLVDGYLKVRSEVYSISSIMRRFAGAGTLSSVVGTLGALHFDLKQRPSVTVEKAELGINNDEDRNIYRSSY
jgi:radical SAM superfamily enzyme YgiQ (UPF0313 family)